jgi:hypothetical protein
MTTRINSIEEACRNDFASVNASIDVLQNGLMQLLEEISQSKLITILKHHPEVHLARAQ